MPVKHGPAPTDTGLHYYRVVDDGSWWRFDHWPKGEAVTTVRLLSRSAICWTDREGNTFNETWNSGDALGGSNANHYNLLSMTRQISVGGGWSATSLDAAAPCTYVPGGVYMCDVTASQAWEAWTNR